MKRCAISKADLSAGLCKVVTQAPPMKTMTRYRKSIQKLVRSLDQTSGVVVNMPVSYSKVLVSNLLAPTQVALQAFGSFIVTPGTFSNSFNL